MSSPTYVFIHIPKTGGTSLLSFLDYNFGKNEIFSVAKESQRIFGSSWRNTPFQERQEAVKNHFFNLPKHKRNNYKIIFGHMEYGWHEALDNPKYISFFRDPVSRVASLYKYILRREGMDLKNQIQSENITLKDFVEKNMHPECQNGITKRLCGSDLYDENDPVKSLNIAQERLAEFEFIGLMEDFDHSLIHFSQLVGARNLYYDRRNVSQKDGKQTPDKIIETYNQLDVALFDQAVQKTKFTLDNDSLLSTKQINKSSLYHYYLKTSTRIKNVVS